MAARIARGPIPTREALAIFLQIAEALEAAHAKRIVHRDASPHQTPSAARRLLRRCLEKDVRRRLQTIGDARIEIEELLEGRGEEPEVPPGELGSEKFPWSYADGKLKEVAPSSGELVVVAEGAFDVSPDGTELAIGVFDGRAPTSGSTTSPVVQGGIPSVNLNPVDTGWKARRFFWTPADGAVKQLR